MKRLPLFMDDKPPLIFRAGMWVLVPIAVVLLLPILVLLVVALYLSAFIHGTRVFVSVFTGRRSSADFDMQKPHFLEMQAPVKAISDQSATEPRTK